MSAPGPKSDVRIHVAGFCFGLRYALGSVNMFMLFLAMALFAWIPVFTVYCFYYFRVLKTRKRQTYVDSIAGIVSKPENLRDMPKVTVIIPARNEESAMPSKIQSVAKLDYDTDKIDVIVVDDNSDDQTCKSTLDAFEEFGLRGEIIRNAHRSGTNASYNAGIFKAKSNMVLLTDADVVIEKDSLKKALTIMANMKDVGAVTAKMRPVSDDKTSATAMESTYISFIEKMLTAESAIHSTFPGYGGFILLRKEAIAPIPVDYGSKDGNIALSTLRKGFKYICLPDVFFYEKISEKLDSQIRQKTRRAARIVQSILVNRDMVFKKQYGQFGKLIFPLRFAMHIICPVLIVIGSLAVFILIFDLSAVLGLVFLSAVCLFLCLGTRTRNRFLRFCSSFAFHQFYLALGLILAPKKMKVWSSNSQRRS